MTSNLRRWPILKTTPWRRTLSAVAAGATLCALTLGGIPAAAAGASHLSLAFFSGGYGAHASWETQDAPAGTLRGIELVNPHATGKTYAGATVTGVTGLTMSEITQLSFMIDTNHYMGAGAPRFSVILSDGVLLYPSAGDCFNRPIVKNTGWLTAEFAAGSTPCMIYGSTGGPATWQQWTRTLGNPTIDALYIIQDEGPATAYIANVSVNGTVAR
ncbi:MAG: hypothetical protein ACYCVA_01340 [Sulfobacillus sp.]